MSIHKFQSPKVYVVAGPNGAGKTTFAAEFLPGFVHCLEFLNADLIAAGLSPFAPEKQNVRAGRLVLTRIRELIKAGQDFGFETTLSGRGYVSLAKRMREEGYQILLFFLWLPSPSGSGRGPGYEPSASGGTPRAGTSHPKKIPFRSPESISTLPAIAG